MSEKISVIMPVYNESKEYVEQSLDSLLEQTYKNIEVLVIIDNPQNYRVIDYLKAQSSNDQRVIILENDKNLGLPKSLNRALKVATGRYIARMDADDISKKDRLYSQLSFLKRENFDLVASNVLDIDETGKLLGTGTEYPITSSKIYKYLRYGDCLPHPTWLGKRRVFESLEGYRDIAACEDYDFILRGRLVGFKYGMIEKPLLYYRINTRGISQTNSMRQVLTSYILQDTYKKGKTCSLEQINTFLANNYEKSESISKKFYLIYKKYLNKILRNIIK